MQIYEISLEPDDLVQGHFHLVPSTGQLHAYRLKSY